MGFQLAFKVSSRGEKSNMFSVVQGVAQGCRLSSILLSVFK